MRKFIMLTACFGVLGLMISGGAYATNAVESGGDDLNALKCIEHDVDLGAFSVFFGSAEWYHDEACQEEILKQVAPVLKQVNKTDCVYTIGYTDASNASGNYDNGELSRNRVAWVRDLLREYYDTFKDSEAAGDESYTEKISKRYTAEPEKRRVDIIYGQCIDKSKEQCNQLIENGKDVGWDEENQKCVCKKEGFVLNEQDQCVETADSEDRRQEEVLVAARSKSRALIISVGRTLDSIKAGFGKSVWKTKDGGFNTARLASDSIAGVVLGTAGGLITSNVIKKNQIKGGFEDIKCTIGGQVVSDWGDDFRVGIGLNGNY